MFEDAVRDGVEEPEGRPRRRLFGGYGPLVGLVAVLLATTVLLPSRPPEVVAAPGGSAPGGAPVKGKAVTGSVTPCPDRTEQVPGDGYSPPCFAFAGDNGGATAKGVTGDAIRISYRRTSVADYQALIAQVGGITGLPPSAPEDIERTFRALVEWFNRNFQLYGRRFEVVPFDGKGSVLAELFGGGQDVAAADAAAAATDVGAFADGTALTVPYNDALTRKQVVALGAPYVSDEYFADRHPYAWSVAPSCTLVTKAATEVGTRMLLGRPARWAGGDLKDRPRKIAVISPDNPEYQQCAAAGQEVIAAAGFEVLQLTYQLDLTAEANQAASIISRLKAEGVTSIGCACDPLLPVYLTGKAQEQGYEPEWLVMGTALTDTDLGGQLYQQDQWSRAFGASALGPQVPFPAQAGYKAYKSISPGDEPAFTVNVVFSQLYMLALGAQMAGPQLTPGTFADGLFAYPGGTGEFGTWTFGPGKYTPQSDAQLIWWDPHRTSALDAKPGAYVVSGERHALGEVPEGEPKVFGP